MNYKNPANWYKRVQVDGVFYEIPANWYTKLGKRKMVD
jgi:hypothetical protein